MPSAEATRNGAVRKPRQKKSSNPTGRLAELFGAGASEGSTMEWDEVDPRFLLWLVVLTTRAGGAITFGRSRDAGALMVTVLLDGDRATTWIPPRDDPDTVLQQLGDKLATLTE